MPSAALFIGSSPDWSSPDWSSPGWISFDWISPGECLRWYGPALIGADSWQAALGDSPLWGILQVD